MTLAGRTALRQVCTWLMALWVSTVAAQPQVLSHIHLTDPDSDRSQRVTLPYFVSQTQSGLLQHTWYLELPTSTAQAQLPSLLLPQPVQGARLSIDGQTIYEFAGSDQQALRNWYRPILISIPNHLLHSDRPTKVVVQQSGHLRGWFIAPLLVGELQSLRPLYEQYTFISQTLSTTINLLSAVVGFFVFLIGWRTHSAALRHAGLGTLTWGVLFTLALIAEIPHRWWFEWRWLTYACTGWLIYHISMFMLAAFGHRPSTVLKTALLVITQLGWVLFTVGGTRVEAALDIVWTGLAVSVYVATSAWVIGVAFKQGQFKKTVPVAVHWLLTSAFALHDYALQAGWLPIQTPTASHELWAAFVFQPIYLTHLALPAFVLMALWLLMQDHIQKTRSELQNVQRLNDQRERIVQDIHDGVGSRINLLLWGLRTQTPDPHHLETELQRCIDELRFAINPQQVGHETLNQALSGLCERLRDQAQARGTALLYEYQGSTHTVTSDLGLHLYKVAQEGLSNALRYSQASQVTVTLTHAESQVVLCIRDNGVGIPNWDNNLQGQINAPATAMGLRSLHSRTQSRGGQTQILSGPTGTTLTVRFTHKTTNPS